MNVISATIKRLKNALFLNLHDDFAMEKPENLLCVSISSSTLEDWANEYKIHHRCTFIAKEFNISFSFKLCKEVILGVYHPLWEWKQWRNAFYTDHLSPTQNADQYTYGLYGILSTHFYYFIRTYQEYGYKLPYKSPHIVIENDQLFAVRCLPSLNSLYIVRESLMPSVIRDAETTIKRSGDAWLLQTPKTTETITHESASKLIEKITCKKLLRQRHDEAERQLQHEWKESLNLDVIPSAFWWQSAESDRFDLHELLEPTFAAREHFYAYKEHLRYQWYHSFDDSYIDSEIVLDVLQQYNVIWKEQYKLSTIIDPVIFSGRSYFTGADPMRIDDLPHIKRGYFILCHSQYACEIDDLKWPDFCNELRTFRNKYLKKKGKLHQRRYVVFRHHRTTNACELIDVLVPDLATTFVESYFTEMWKAWDVIAF